MIELPVWLVVVLSAGGFVLFCFAVWCVYFFVTLLRNWNW